MKFKFLAVLLLSIFSISTVYAGTTTDHKKHDNQKMSAENKKDAEMLGVLIVINKNEIAAAKVAESRKVSPEVKNYAEMMKKAHTKNLKETEKLTHKIGKVKENDDAKSLEKDGKKELATLKDTNGDNFQKTYMNDMVTDHQNALDKLDGFIKDANNADVKKHLEMTREHVQMHLDKAKEIQDQLNKA